MGYKLETTALISIDNYNAFRIRRIMLILDNLTLYTTNFTEPLSYQASAFLKLPEFP